MRGLAARRDRLVVVLRRRVVVFVLGKGEVGLWREGAYQTCDNPKGSSSFSLFLLSLFTQPRQMLKSSLYRSRRTRYRSRFNTPRLPRSTARSSPTRPPPALRPLPPSSSSASLSRPNDAPVPLRLHHPRARILPLRARDHSLRSRPRNFEQQRHSRSNLGSGNERTRQGAEKGDGHRRDLWNQRAEGRRGSCGE